MQAGAFLLLAILVAAGLAVQGANPFADTQSKDEAVAAFKDVENQLVKKDANGLRSLFQAWKAQYKISYAPAEDGQRYANFEATLRRIIRTNRDTRSSYWASLNQFSAMTDEEFKATLAASLQRKHNGTASTVSPAGGRRSLLALPNSKNWVLEGKVTPVKNQGSCGCCWAFAGTAAIESRALIAMRKTVSTYKMDLSEQQIVDCAKAPYFPYSFGCGGGQLEDPFGYSARGFQAPESLYPYTKVQGGCRRVAATSGRVTLSGIGFTEVPMNSATALKQALMTSPVSLAYYTSEPSFRDYKGGIYNPSKCGGTYMVDHAVLLVGYDNSQKSWLFKNSWGSYWGEKGYFRMSMKPDGTQGTCQMYTWAVQPTNLKYPAPV